MTNVLWLVSWYPSRIDNFTGDFIERHARSVSKYVQLTVLVILKDETLGFNEVQIEKTVDININVYRVYYGKTKMPLWLESILSIRKYFQLQKKIYRLIKNDIGKPDILHVHVAMKAGILALFLKMRYRIPFVVTENWTGYYPHSKPSIYDNNFVFKKLNKAILQKSDMFLPVSKDLGQTVNKYFAKVKYQVVPNVVDAKLFFYNDDLKLSKFRFIHPSLMNYQKNAEGILQACVTLKARGYDFELLMVGNEDEKLKNFAEQNDLLNDTVFFLPAVSYVTVAQHMQQSSALVLFSRFENLPCVVLEALCCGLPVISSRVGGVPEVVNETNGILVNSENIDQLVNAMQAMIDNYVLYDKISIAKKATDEFNYNTIGSQYSAIYKTILSNSNTYL